MQKYIALTSVICSVMPSRIAQVDNLTQRFRLQCRHAARRLVALFALLTIAGWTASGPGTGLHPGLDPLLAGVRLSTGGHQVMVVAEARVPSHPPTSVTSTVTLTPMPASDVFVYVPYVEKQIIVPGAVSLVDVYTTTIYGDDTHQSVFQPCQAVVFWFHLSNTADIPQPATIFWRTTDTQGRLVETLSGTTGVQVKVPPGGNTWRFLQAPLADAPAGQYHYQAWAPNPVTPRTFDGTLTIEGEPIPMRYLEGFTATYDPRNYDFLVPREIVPGRVYARVPVRVTDTFTTDEPYVIQVTLWEGVKEDNVVFTRRYRPDGRPFGSLVYGFRDYERAPGCVRHHVVHWEIDEWMKMSPGQWRLEVSGNATDWETLLFTLVEP